MNADTAAAATTCRWAIAGCGWVARDHFLPGLLEAARQQPATAVPRLVAVTDADPVAATRLAARTPGVRAVPRLADLLADHRPDAVYVATPNHAHRPVAEAAAAAGAAVLCEKPLAAGLADAERLVAACERAGVPAATAYDQRFHPAHQAARDVVASGGLGTVTAVRITYCCWLPPAWSPDGGHCDNWRSDPARAGGGALIDLAPHGLDLVGVLLGGDDVTRLAALVQHRVHPYRVDDGAVLAGRTDGGVLVCLHVAYNTPDALPRRRLEIVGTRGLLTATDTLGQDAGGAVWLTGANTARRVPVAFDAGASPFAGQVRGFSAAVAAARAGTARERVWPWPLRRDLALHRLLLEALARADGATAEVPPSLPAAGRTPSTTEEGRR
ncbi:Gfo/Idh/MocA family oxidoreductase [Streptomyces verrucosisporus]|uniref:Gfo/Idh/MocA family protein n=1 Tax=Streptomyces verrucosisporus TaxID=1695161 RepID=UPI0019CF7C76|nr:Gfo/Idh/MocA family oxidoreductase [Streptomyces verrucosisporus]MBN3932906.1 Gfo/Idh/MocA family oxidoreductase [Streptomyces verrucosisporus]